MPRQTEDIEAAIVSYSSEYADPEDDLFEDEKVEDDEVDKDVDHQEEQGASGSPDKVEESAPPKQDKVESDDDDDEMEAASVTGGKKLQDEAEEESNKKKKILIGAGVVALLLFLLILGLVFAPNSGPAGTSLTNPDPVNETAAPTFSPPTPEPTASPTKPGATRSPTVHPTTAPTPFPTAPTVTPEFPQISALPCDEIREQDEVNGENDNQFDNFQNWDVNGVSICGDTWGGVDPERPKWSPFTIQQGRRDCPLRTVFGVSDVCAQFKARICRINELENLVAQGTGCGGDRGFVWTQSSCTTDGGASGYYMYDFGLRDAKAETKCESDLSLTSVVRCCGDNY